MTKILTFICLMSIFQTGYAQWPKPIHSNNLHFSLSKDYFKTAYGRQLTDKTNLSFHLYYDTDQRQVRDYQKVGLTAAYLYTLQDINGILFVNLGPGVTGMYIKGKVSPTLGETEIVPAVGVFGEVEFYPFSSFAFIGDINQIVLLRSNFFSTDFFWSVGIKVAF